MAETPAPSVNGRAREAFEVGVWGSGHHPGGRVGVNGTGKGRLGEVCVGISWSVNTSKLCTSN